MNEKQPNPLESSEIERFFRHLNGMWDKGEAVSKGILHTAEWAWSVMGWLMGVVFVCVMGLILFIGGTLLLNWFKGLG